MMTYKTLALIIVAGAAALCGGCPQAPATDPGTQQTPGQETPDAGADNGPDSANDDGGASGADGAGGDDVTPPDSGDGAAGGGDDAAGGAGDEPMDGGSGDDPADPPPDDGGGAPPADDVVAPLAGAYSGPVNRLRTESVGGPNDVTQAEIASLFIEFEDQGMPLAIPVPGHSDIPDLAPTLRDVGDTVTLGGQFPDGGDADRYDVTFTVVSAAYTGDQAELLIDIQFTSLRGSLRRNGTGVHRVSAALAGDTLLMYAGVTEYEVTWGVGSLRFDVTEAFDDQGELPRQ